MAFELYSRFKLMLESQKRSTEFVPFGLHCQQLLAFCESVPITVKDEAFAIQIKAEQDEDQEGNKWQVAALCLELLAKT
jgi:hypothetical protein